MLICRMFYGPGGPYALFSGKAASRALAKMSFEEKDPTGDIFDLSGFELGALQDWEYKFMSKYVKVGTIKSSVPVTEVAKTNGEPSESSAPGDGTVLRQLLISLLEMALLRFPPMKPLNERFGTAEVRIVPRLGSDHHPIVVRLEEEKKGFQERPFRFQAAWLLHDSFPDIMRNNWSETLEAHQNLSSLRIL
ncbi:hypothetical protein K1719_016997 [Acacia pycnantha]|nr:hypothetical protein K1719_016997 [Acacia pycnantha]